MASETRRDDAKLSYPQLHDIPQVSIVEAKKQLKLTIDSNQHRGCLVLVGEAGLGKTQVINQIAKEEDYKVVTIHTAQWGPLGCGIPSRDEMSQFFKLIVPDIFPKPKEKCILLFDEINRGQAHAIAMFFNLIEDRSMFDYHLPDNCVVIATMNPNSSSYNVTSIENDAAIRRRLKFLYVSTNLGAFLAHAQTDIFHSNSAISFTKGKPCHPQVLAFFKATPDKIYDRKAQEQHKQFSCPATIETISEDAYLLEKAGVSLHGVDANIRFSASIGTTMTSTLVNFLKDNSTAISATDVIYKYSKVALKVSSLVNTSKHEHLSELCTNVVTIMFSDKPDANIIAENVLLFWKDLPSELTTGVLSQMKATAAEASATDYLKSLMRELGKHEDWINIHKRLDETHRKVDQALKVGR